MLTAYHAANALEAHMIADLLRQEGLDAQVLGEHLQGAVGELPAAGLVRVLVAEHQLAAAQAVIARWEAAQPPDTPQARRAGTSSAEERRLWWAFGLGIVVGYLLAQWQG